MTLTLRNLALVQEYSQNTTTWVKFPIARRHIAHEGSSQTWMLMRKPGSLHSNSYQRFSLGLSLGFCAGLSSSPTQTSLIHVFMDCVLCTGLHSCWNWTCCTGGILSWTMLEFTEILRATHSFINVCRSSLHAEVLLYTHGHGSDWNTWNKWLGWVTEYFW